MSSRARLGTSRRVRNKRGVTEFVSVSCIRRVRDDKREERSETPLVSFGTSNYVHTARMLSRSLVLAVSLVLPAALTGLLSLFSTCSCVPRPGAR